MGVKGDHSCTQGFGTQVPTGLCPPSVQHPHTQASGALPTLHLVPRDLGSCPPLIWHPHTQESGVLSTPTWYPCTQGSGVLPTPLRAPTYAEVWGPAHSCLAPIYPGLWGTPHPSSSTRTPQPMVQHPTSQLHAPTDTGAFGVPSLMLGHGATPWSSVCSPKGAGGTQWVTLTGNPLESTEHPSPPHLPGC